MNAEIINRKNAWHRETKNVGRRQQWDNTEWLSFSGFHERCKEHSSALANQHNKKCTLSNKLELYYTY